MVDQTIFKTAQKYGFNSLYFDEINLYIIDDYVQYVRSLLNSQCDYLRINRNWFAVSETRRSTKRARVSSDWQVHTSDKVEADHRDRERKKAKYRRPEAQPERGERSLLKAAISRRCFKRTNLHGKAAGGQGKSYGHVCAYRNNVRK